MSPELPIHKLSVPSQRGAGLPVAIFIITVLSLLVLTMADLQDSSSQSVSLQIQSQRAFFAAESGVQLTLAMILPETENAAEVWGNVVNKSIEDNDIDFIDAAGLRGCAANVKAEPIPDKDDPVLVKVTSTGSCGAPGSIDSAQRTVEVRLR